MIKRIVDISNSAKLSLKNSQLVISQDNKDSTIPVEDIGILILDNPAIICTQGVLNECYKNNTLVVMCDNRHLPSAVLLPLSGHTLQTKILSIQCNATKPTQKKIWQSIVKAKVKAQARVLESVAANPKYLNNLIPQIRSGDSGNVEAKAARYYWQELFGKSFRRGNDSHNINHLLNYGYAIIRAACARAIVGSGLHPSIGVHHHNQYDTFCLADDLMEPLRPLVDIKVYEILQEQQENIELNNETKSRLLSSLSMNCSMEKQRLPLMVAMHHYTASISKALGGEVNSIQIPKI